MVTLWIKRIQFHLMNQSKNACLKNVTCSEIILDNFRHRKVAKTVPRIPDNTSPGCPKC